MDSELEKQLVDYYDTKNIPYWIMLYDKLPYDRLYEFADKVVDILLSKDISEIERLLRLITCNTNGINLSILRNKDNLGRIVEKLYKENRSSGYMFDYIVGLIDNNSYFHDTLSSISIDALLWMIKNIVKDKEKANDIMTYQYIIEDKQDEFISKGIVTPLDMLLQVSGDAYVGEREDILNIIFKYKISINDLYRDADLTKWSWIRIIEILDEIIPNQV